MLASHQHTPADDDDRKNRFGHPDSSQPASLRERAASQPPRSTANSSSPSLPHTSTAYLSSVSPSLARPPASPWRFNSASHLNPSTAAMPIRSSSFSATAPSLQALSSLRESRGFPSTFEDDESEFNEGMSDQYTPVDDERFILPPQQQHRGRSFAADLTRSRSQSLATATTRPAPIGSPFSSSGLQGWLEGQPSSLSSHPLSIPTSGNGFAGGGAGGRYGDIKPPGSSRYGSLGVQSHARSPLNHDLSSFPSSSSFRRQPSTSSTSSSSTSYSPSAALQVPSAHNHNHGHHLSPGGFAGGSPHQVDISNMSPFMRDVGQILLDDGSAFREQLWSGMNPPRDENGGGGSGTTSRRHSVSVVQPRRGTIVGFNAPSSTQHVNGGDFNDFAEDEFQGQGGVGGRVGGIFPGGGGGSFGRGGLLLTDEDLADNLNGLSLGEGGASSSSGHGHMGGQTSQPSSLPAYASRSPPSVGGGGGGLGSASYQALQLHIPGSIGSGRGGVIGTPSEGGTSPSLGEYLPQGHGHESSYLSHHQQQHQGQQQQQGSGRGGVMPRYIPGMGIQMVPNDGPVSPTTYARLGGGRNSLVGNNMGYHHQQQQHVSQNQGSMFTQPLQRRPSSDFTQQQPPPHLQTQPPHLQSSGQGAQGGGQLGAQGVHDLGKGVPLHSVASCPLYIVEFKAGRTDLFYAMPGVGVGMGVGGVEDIR